MSRETRPRPAETFAFLGDGLTDDHPGHRALVVAAALGMGSPWLRPTDRGSQPHG